MTEDLSQQGPLIPIKAPPEGRKTFFFGSKVSVDLPNYARDIEQVFFDIKPVFPCSALVIGNTTALLVVPLRDAVDDVRPAAGEGEDHFGDAYVRIGISDSMYGLEKMWEVVDRERFVTTVTII